MTDFNWSVISSEVCLDLNKKSSFPSPLSVKLRLVAYIFKLLLHILIVYISRDLVDYLLYQFYVNKSIKVKIFMQRTLKSRFSIENASAIWIKLIAANCILIIFVGWKIMHVTRFTSLHDYFLLFNFCFKINYLVQRRLNKIGRKHVPANKQRNEMNNNYHFIFFDPSAHYT